MVTAAYRVFSQLAAREAAVRRPTGRGVELKVSEKEDRIPPLIFLIRRNKAGCDAVAETGAAGHEGIAQWVEGVAGFRWDNDGF